MKLEIQQLQTQAEQYWMRMEGDLKELQEFDAVKRQEIGRRYEEKARHHWRCGIKT